MQLQYLREALDYTIWKHTVPESTPKTGSPARLKRVPLKNSASRWKRSDTISALPGSSGLVTTLTTSSSVRNFL